MAEGNRDEMLAACYAAWKADVEAGKSSLMLAVDNATVAELNRLARSERVASGLVAGRGLALADGSVAGVGDVVVARHNDRHLRMADGEWVRNRDRFVVTATHQDGAMAVRAVDGDGEVLLPAGYVAEHVELGYAGTVFSGPGSDRGHRSRPGRGGHDPRGPVRSGHPGPGGQPSLHRRRTGAGRGRDGPWPSRAPECPRGAGRLRITSERRPFRPSDRWLRSGPKRPVSTSLSGNTRAWWRRPPPSAGRGHWTVPALPAGVLAQARQSPEWPGLLSALRDAEDRGLDVGSALPELAKLPR